jgi:hypothetical protein
MPAKLMRDQKSNTLFRQPANPVPLENDENRIDWDRKNQKKKRQDPDNLLDGVLEPLVEDEEILDEVVLKPKKSKPGKAGKRDKRRQLVLDEASGHVRVKRRRKTNRNLFDAWLDEYE